MTARRSGFDSLRRKFATINQRVTKLQLTQTEITFVPSIIAVRAADMGALASEFFDSLLLFVGLLIIAFHQYWSSAAAVLISLFGWVLAIRGFVLMAAPGLYEHAVVIADAVWLVRLMFGVLIVIGVYLTYVGWVTKPGA